jgi:exonuclease III
MRPCAGNLERQFDQAAHATAAAMAGSAATRDLVCLQETKLTDDAFAQLLGEQLVNRGYEFALHGDAQWNCVAILSKVGLDDLVVGVAGAPGVPNPEARAIAATCGGIRVHSVYVSSGRLPSRTTAVQAQLIGRLR